MSSRRHIVFIALVLAALLPTVAAASTRSNKGLAGLIVKNAGGTYSLWILSDKAGFTDVNLIITGGSTLSLTKPGPHCKLQGTSTIDCSPYPVPVNKPQNVFTFKASPALGKTTEALLTFEGKRSSNEFKIAENEHVIPQNRILIALDYLAQVTH